MRIAFVIPTLGPGGAERVGALLSNFWASEGHCVDLVTFEDPETEPFQNLQGVTLHRLGTMNQASAAVISRILCNCRRVMRLRFLLKRLRPDILLAFMTEANVVALLAARSLRIPVLISERNQPERQGLGQLHRATRRISYGWSSAIIMQSEPTAAWARVRFAVPVHVIANPVLLNTARVCQGRTPANRIYAVGRLVEQKGFDVLIESFARIAAKHPEWRLVIYGEGPQRTLLERHVKTRGLEGQIKLPGLKKDIALALTEADLFVLPSRYEGYPNVLIEALACGLPVVATDCPGGTAEILYGGVYGMLVASDDARALAGALDRMMSSPDLRADYARRAPLAVANLEVGLIGARWIELMKRFVTAHEQRGYAHNRETLRAK